MSASAPGVIIEALSKPSLDFFLVLSKCMQLPAAGAGGSERCLHVSNHFQDVSQELG